MSFPDSKEKWSRRSLLEWMGKGCAMTLGAAALASCRDSDSPSIADAPGSRDWRVTDPDGEILAPGDAGVVDLVTPGDITPASGEFPFQPGTLTDPALLSWGERTVDKQDLGSILSSWRLNVNGMVKSPRTYTFADVVGLGLSTQLVDFHCVEGWSVHDVPWNGVHLSQIFAQVEPDPQATHLTFHTVGEKYNESLPIPVALEPRTTLAVGIDGFTLPLKHGFPLRIVIPRLLAYKSAKFVHHIEFTDHPVEGFWVKAGYDYDGEVQPSRLRPGKY